MAALVMVGLILLQVGVFIAWPPPDTGPELLALFQRNWFLGLLSMDLLYLVDNALMVLIYIALYVALRPAGKSAMTIGLGLSLVGLAAYYASNTAFEMLALSRQYAAAATDAQRTVVLAAGETLLAIYRGTAFDVYYVLNAVALLIFSAVMLRSDVFNKATAYLGLLAGILMAVPSTAGTIGLVMSLLSLLPWTVWLILFALRLFQLGKQAGKR